MTPIKCTTEVSKEGSLSHKIMLEVLTKLNAAALFQRTAVTFQHNPPHCDASVQAWLQIKSDIVVEFGLLHSQPITNNHYHFLVTLESATPSMLLQA